MSPRQLQKEKKIVDAPQNDPIPSASYWKRLIVEGFTLTKTYYKIKREQEEQEEIRKAESVPTISKTNFNDKCSSSTTTLGR